MKDFSERISQKEWETKTSQIKNEITVIQTFWVKKKKKSISLHPNHPLFKEKKLFLLSMNEHKKIRKDRPPSFENKSYLI